MRKVLFLLSHLSETDLEWVMDHGDKMEVPAGSVLIARGEPIDSLYIVLSGTLEVRNADVDGKSVQVGCGEVLGEVSMLDPRPPMATVVGHTDAIVLALSLETLQDKLQVDEYFAAHFYHSLAVLLAHRLRKTVQRLVYGGNESLEESEEYEDELNPDMLDTLHITGNLFNRALHKKLSE